MASQDLAVTPGARVIAAPWLEGGERIDAIAPLGASIEEIVGVALPGFPREALATNVRVYIGDEIVEFEDWTRAPPPTSVVIVRVVPGNSGTFRAVLSISVAVAALALGQVYALPLAKAAGFGGSALAVSAAGGIITGTTLLAGTFLINSLVPLRRPQEQPAGGATTSPANSISGLRNSANPGGVIPYVFGKVRFAPPYAALPYTEAANGETYVRAVFLVGPGPVKIRDIRLGETPIERFKEVEIEVREGLPGDLPVTLYPKQVLEDRSFSTDLSAAYAATYGAATRFTASDADEASVDITFPAGLFQMVQVPQPGGGTAPFPFPMTVGFLIEQRLNGAGSWSTVLNWTIGDSTLQARTYSHRWKLPARGRYEIRVTRTTADLDDLNVWLPNVQYSTRSIWTAIRSFRPEYPINYDGPLALIAVRVRASKQLNGVIDNLNCEVTRICKDWNGSAWVDAETQNCASQLRWAMQGPAMTYPLADADIDLDGLADFHDFCASKSLKYNRVVDFEASVKDIWDEIAAAGRAAVRDDGEKWGVVIDEPKTQVMQHITPRNSSDFSWSRPYVRFPHAWNVSFNDETNLYKPAVRTVLWPGFVGTPTIFENISFPGITGPAEVWREARRRMYELIHRRNTYFAMMDFEGALAVRGDLVHLSHDVLLSTQSAARVKVVGANSVTIDGFVTMEAGKTYALRFRSLGPNDATPDLSVLRSVVTVEGEHSTLFFSDAGALPDRGDLVMFGETGKVTRECVVKDVEGADDLARRFTLIDHAPQIHTTADAETPPPWNGRVGEEISNTGPRADFSKITNIQLLDVL